MEYTICEELFPIVEKKLNRIAKKCVKHGNDFVFEVTGEEIHEVKNHETGKMESYKFVVINVEGTAKIEDWECIAVLDIHDSGNVIRRINTQIDIPERFKNSENICEHCGSHRFRNNLYVIHNVVTDEWKQVGGSCLKLYTGGLSMEYVAAYLDGITELESYDGVVTGCSNRYYDVKEIIGYATEVIAKIGYFNSSCPLPTKTLVKHFPHNSLSDAVEKINKELKTNDYDICFNRKDFHLPDTEDKVNSIIEYYLSLEDKNEFIHNVQVILKEEYVEMKNFGFICYLPEGYAKHIQTEAERAERERLIKERKSEEVSEYFGEIGKRYKDMKIKFVNDLASWQTDWGVTYVYKIVIEGGFVLTWKTSTAVYTEHDEEYDTISFTVKAHSDYNGQPQTEVTRCKINKKIKE